MIYLKLTDRCRDRLFTAFRSSEFFRGLEFEAHRMPLVSYTIEELRQFDEEQFEFDAHALVMSPNYIALMVSVSPIRGVLNLNERSATDIALMESLPFEKVLSTIAAFDGVESEGVPSSLACVGTLGLLLSVTNGDTVDLAEILEPTDCKVFMQLQQVPAIKIEAKLEFT